MVRRVVRATPQFFQDVDRQFGRERGADGERGHGKVVVRERSRWYRPSGSCSVGHHEAVHVVEHHSGHDLAKCPVITFVGTLRWLAGRLAGSEPGWTDTSSMRICIR